MATRSVTDELRQVLPSLLAQGRAAKTLSFVLLALFPIALLLGLWRRSWRLLAASAGLIVIFYLLMHYVAAKARS